MKNSPKKQMPSAATAGQSRRIGHRARRSSATGSTQRKPMPQRRTASVSGSASPTRYRVTAAAVPPSALETIAMRTPSPNPASCPGEHGYGIFLLGIVSATTSEVSMPREKGFAALLRWWRQRRGWSQLDLAQRADISQRHLSFLELGRASPSRDMVAQLAAALDLPFRQQNALLLAAGFAPLWRESELSAPELVQVRKALDYIMNQQEPFPADGVDRHWNVLK